jgi:hypothetical protein
MMAKSSFVNFPQKSFSIVNGDTPLKDARDVALVKFVVYYSKGLRSAYNTLGSVGSSGNFWSIKYAKKAPPKEVQGERLAL